MSEKHVKKIPGLGMRSLKTAISVAACLVFFELFSKFVFPNFDDGKEIPFYACTAAIICMQNTVENSISSGIFRLIGTFVGGALGLLSLLILPYMPRAAQFVIITVGILVCIVICNMLKKQKSCAIACVVFLAVISVIGNRSPFSYALYRIFETAAGVVIVIIVNKFLVVPKFISRRFHDDSGDGADSAEAAAQQGRIPDENGGSTDVAAPAQGDSPDGKTCG